MEGCRKIVAPSTGRGIFPCVGTQGPDTWSNRAMIDIEIFLSSLLAAYGGGLQFLECETLLLRLVGMFKL